MEQKFQWIFHHKSPTDYLHQTGNTIPAWLATPAEPHTRLIRFPHNKTSAELAFWSFRQRWWSAPRQAVCLAICHRRANIYDKSRPESGRITSEPKPAGKQVPTPPPHMCHSTMSNRVLWIEMASGCDLEGCAFLSGARTICLTHKLPGWSRWDFGWEPEKGLSTVREY